MKHKTWFRLVVKAIGLLVMSLSIGHIVNTFLAYLGEWIETGGVTWRAWMLSYGLGQSVAFLFGLYLFLGGEWVVNKAIPSNRPYCPECGYELAHHTSPKCPECGVALPEKPGV